jgi:hypothetical protein
LQSATAARGLPGIKVLWKVYVKIRNAQRRGVYERLERFTGEKNHAVWKIIEFGTVTDKRSRVVDGKTITESETNPYFRMDGKIYEIITFTNQLLSVTSARTPQEIIKVIEAKDLNYLKSLDEFEFYERPCHSSFAGITGDRFCNEDREVIRMSF